MSSSKHGALALIAALVVAAPAPKPVQFRAFADTGIKLTDVLWTGSRFLYLENTTNTVWAAGPAGTPVVKFASMPSETEETRCRLSPGTHGFAPRDIYCHAPDNMIYRISPDGSSVTIFAKLPDSSVSDGALAFDTVGRFGYALIAATGRSGGGTPNGGVYAISPSGTVRIIASYSAAAGADEVAIAPARFGTAAGDAVLTVDAGSTGELLAVDPQGGVRTIAKLPDGPNPIVSVSAPSRHAAGVAAGLYVTDTNSHVVWFAPAAQLRPYVGDLIVGTELKAQFWIVQPRAGGFQTRLLSRTLPMGTYNLEGAVYVAG